MKNVLLIGLGRFGSHIAKQLHSLGHEIMAVDVNEERVNKILPFVTNAQIGDSTDAEFLESLGVGNYDICFVTIGDSFQNSLETTSLLKEWIGKTVGELDIRKKYRINIIAVKNGREMNMTITPDTLLENHVSLLVLGEYKAIQKCFHI